jgi:probable DNA repair protein
MYDWLAEALQAPSQVVITANRRLAAVLTDRFGQLQVAAGRSAWQSPQIHTWQDWLATLVAAADVPQLLPARLNTHQGRVVWEQCLRHELSSPLLNIGAVVRQAREAWRMIHDFEIPLDAVAATAVGRDQGTFARAAQRFANVLDERGWIDDARLCGAATQLVADGSIKLPEAITLAGFDRYTPAATTLFAALERAGCKVHRIRARSGECRRRIASTENPDAEMRAAGAWAREALTAAPGMTVAVVASNLEKDAARRARLVREGFAPGWQLAGEPHRLAVNVSYGRRLNSYPAIAIALLALRWLHEDIGSRDLARLLRSGAIGQGELGDRSRMELELRGFPAMTWSPARASNALSRKSGLGEDWLRRITELEAIRARTPDQLPPSAWAARFDDLLLQLHWPGEAPLGSSEFQLHNRWRELLNDLARLDIVLPSLTLTEALRRVQVLAGEAVFQPENKQGMVQLIGPLEASGMEFDRLWISGLSNSDWPPPGRPLTLLSRQLQRDFGLPDASPDDTVAYARRVLGRLAHSAPDVVLSYPLSDGDAEQRPSGLLVALGPCEAMPASDPGWYANTLSSAATPPRADRDPVPPVTADEVLSGGTSTLAYQVQDPFAAFAYGRLGVRPIQAFASGLPPNVRGTLIHRALHAMYRDLPTRDEIAGPLATELPARHEAILDYAFGWIVARADFVLRQFLELEKTRVLDLLRAVIAEDARRQSFRIGELESAVSFAAGPVRLDLRIDRIDHLAGGGLRIIDYKTGRRRQFLGADKQPAEVQLVAYACAIEDAISDLAYFNVDSRQVEVSGAGLELTPDLEWEAALARWKDAILAAAKDFAAGDVRINADRPARDTRAFGLLSRVRELVHAG